MTITTVGIDLAKNVFQVHGVDERGKAMLKKQLKRAQMTVFLRLCRRVSLGWKPVAVLTTGLVSCNALATRCG
ncbi:transposase [Variovorax boronicumulans]|nr:transposase [Variovorax boronicumulans]